MILAVLLIGTLRKTHQEREEARGEIHDREGAKRLFCGFHPMKAAKRAKELFVLDVNCRELKSRGLCGRRPASAPYSRYVRHPPFARRKPQPGKGR